MSKVPWLNLLKMVIASLLVAVIFGMYLYFVGIPSTRARNLYNASLTVSSLTAREKLLTESLNTWYEPYVADELAKLQELAK